MRFEYNNKKGMGQVLEVLNTELLDNMSSHQVMIKLYMCTVTNSHFIGLIPLSVNDPTQAYGRLNTTAVREKIKR